MNLFIKTFFSTLLVLALPSIPIILGGYFMMSEIIYDMHKKTFANEIIHIKNHINEAETTLKEAGVDGIEYYSNQAKAKMLQNVNSYHYGDTGELYIANNKGQLLTNNHDVNHQFIDAEMIKNTIQQHKTKGNMELIIDKKTYVIMFDKSPTWQWLIFFEIEKDEIFKKRDNYLIFAISVIGIVFFIVMLISYILTQNNLTKLNLILQYLKNIENGELYASMPNINNKYKLGIIQNGIISMVQKITQANKTMQHEIEQRTYAEIAMITAKEEAEYANLAKSQFIANMSHELRTPINAIIGYSEILGEDLEDSQANLDYKQACIDITRVNNSAKYLLSLINDVLDISKLEANKVEVFIEKFYLDTFLTEVIEISQPIISNKNNQLILNKINDLGAIHTDKTKLRQIILNLLSNAAKFSNHSIITLRVEQLTKNNNKDYINIQVIDQGIGIHPNQLSKIFQSFTQADSSTTRKYGGTGLGLTISKKFAEKMEGDLSVKSIYEKGSVFTLELPMYLEKQS